MCSACFPQPGLPADASLSSTGSSGASSPASAVLSKRYDFLLPISPHFVSFVWRYLGSTRCFRSPADECAAGAWSWSPGNSGRDVAEETTGSPKFLGNLDCPSARVLTDAGRTPAPDHFGAAAWPPHAQVQRLPRVDSRRSIARLSDSLSTLRRADRSYPTQDSLPVAGQALPDGLSTHKIPLKGFKIVSLHLSPPFPSFAWHNGRLLGPGQTLCGLSES